MTTKKREPKKPQAKPLEEASKSFTDALGRKWSPRLDTPTVIEACRALDITLKKVLDIENINIGDLLDLVWYACKYQAIERKMTYEDFTEALTFDVYPRAFEAIGAVLELSFPSAADMTKTMGAAAQQGPFAPGS